MLRHLTLLACVTLLLSPTALRLATHLQFQLDQERIARELCVNRPFEDIPMCLGSCVLVDWLEAVDFNPDDLQPSPFSGSEVPTDILYVAFSTEPARQQRPPSLRREHLKPRARPLHHPRIHPGSVFRPPAGLA